MTGSTVSTHVLDATRGRPGVGVVVRLERLAARLGPPEQPPEPVAVGVTDEDGRLADLAADVPAGTYRLSFDTAGYYARTGTETFFPRVDVVFTVPEPGSGPAHHHVPVLLSPFAFSAYRGS